MRLWRCFILITLLQGNPAWCNTITRYVKPDGSVIYSDHPIEGAVAERVLPLVSAREPAVAREEPSVGSPTPTAERPPASLPKTEASPLFITPSKRWGEYNIRALEQALGHAAVAREQLLHRQLDYWEQCWQEVKNNLAHAQTEFEKNPSTSTRDEFYRQARRQWLHKEQEYLALNIEQTQKTMATGTDEDIQSP